MCADFKKLSSPPLDNLSALKLCNLLTVLLQYLFRTKLNLHF